MNLSEPVAGLEIGTTRTVIAIGEPLANGHLKVAAIESIPSSGVRKSQIIDVAQARYSIESVLRKLVEQSDYSIGHAFLAVSGPQIRTTTMSAQWQVERGIVHEEDITEVDNRSYDMNLPPERLPLELSQISYGLDDLSGISSPKGMSGHLLKLHSLCIHGSTQRITDAKSAARTAKLEIGDVCFAGTCAATAVLTPQQKRDGALVIDLGGGSTSYTAWTDGKLVHAGVIGVGGDHVTNDIRIAFSVSQAQAEQLKTSSSAATIGPDDATSRIPVPSPMPGFKAATISHRALNTVVNARMQELFTIIRTKIDEANLLHRLNAGVFLTGGGSALNNIVPLAVSVFGCGVQIGSIIPEVKGLEQVEHPASLATIVGLLLQAQIGTPEKPHLMDWFHNMFGGKKK